MNVLITAILLLAGLIHLVPVIGVLGPARLRALYGIPVEGSDLRILLRHRAILFGLLGLLLAASAFRPGLRPLAVGAGLVSMLSFVALARMEGNYNALIRKVVVTDIIASAGLLLVLVLGRLG